MGCVLTSTGVFSIEGHATVTGHLGALQTCVGGTWLVTEAAARAIATAAGGAHLTGQKLGVGLGLVWELGLGGSAGIDVQLLFTRQVPLAGT